MFELKILDMKNDDIPQVLAIEREAFPDPWTKIIFVQELSHVSSRCIVARDVRNDRIMGYGCFRWYDAHADIMNLAVRRDSRRKNIGEQLLTYIKKDLCERSVSRVFLEVRADNIPALALYKKHGFIVNRIKKKYYKVNAGDAVEMLFQLGSDLQLTIKKEKLTC